MFGSSLIVEPDVILQQKLWCRGAISQNYIQGQSENNEYIVCSYTSRLLCSQEHEMLIKMLEILKNRSFGCQTNIGPQRHGPPEVYIGHQWRRITVYKRKTD